MPARMRVLVVESRVMTAAAFALWLESWGHEVRLAYSGSAALRLAQDYLPHVVVVSLDLAGSDALDLGRRLRAQRGLEEVLLVGVSDHAGRDGRSNCRAAGFASFLANPIDPQVLEGLVAGKQALPSAVRRRCQRCPRSSDPGDLGQEDVSTRLPAPRRPQSRNRNHPSTPCPSFRSGRGRRDAAERCRFW